MNKFSDTKHIVEITDHQIDILVGELMDNRIECTEFVNRSLADQEEIKVLKEQIKIWERAADKWADKFNNYENTLENIKRTVHSNRSDVLRENILFVIESSKLK